MAIPLHSRVARQRGVTLTELMIALVLGALVVLAATAMVVTSRGTYRTQDESTRLAESARFGLELSNRLVRLAGYTNFGNPNSTDPNTPPASYVADTVVWPVSPDSYSLDGPNIVGSNNSVPSGAAGLNGSDSLTIRYFGSNNITGVADGNVLDCAGFPVPEPKVVTANNLDQENRRARAFNVLFVEPDTDGEPALKCQRQTYDPLTGVRNLALDKQTLIRGVEDFQVLYGEVVPQAAPNNDLDLNAPASLVYRTGIGGVNHVVDWNNVRTVRIAMLLRSATGARSDVEPATDSYKLFGDAYSAAVSGDPGNTFNLTSLSAIERTRVRRVVETTVFIRNRMSDWPSLKVN